MYFNVLFVIFFQITQSFVKNMEAAYILYEVPKRISVDLLSVGVRRRHLLGALTVATAAYSVGE